MPSAPPEEAPAAVAHKSEPEVEFYEHAPSVDPALLAELKAVTVCRETGETKLHRMTRMGHEVGARSPSVQSRAHIRSSVKIYVTVIPL